MFANIFVSERDTQLPLMAIYFAHFRLLTDIDFYSHTCLFFLVCVCDKRQISA